MTRPLLAAAFLVCSPAFVFAQYGGYGNNQNNNPNPPPIRPNPNNNAAVIADRNQITTANADLTRAKTDLAAAVQKITTEFQKAPDWSDAQKAVDAASKDVDKARTAVMARLKTQPDYQAATKKVATAQAKLDQLKASGASKDAIFTQSQDVLTLSGVSGKMEKEALDADVPYQATMKTLADANGKQKELRDKLAELVKTDTTFVDLRQKQTDAQKKVTDLNSKLTVDLRAAGG